MEPETEPFRQQLLQHETRLRGCCRVIDLRNNVIVLSIHTFRSDDLGLLHGVRQLDACAHGDIAHAQCAGRDDSFTIALELHGSAAQVNTDRIELPLRTCGGSSINEYGGEKSAHVA